MNDYSETALQILEAARQLFSEKGFKATSTKKIAAAAKVNEVSIFRLFGSKDKLFDAVIEQFLFRPNFQVLLQAQETPLNNFLLQLGRFLKELLSRNIALIKIELKHQEKMMGERSFSRFPREIKALLVQKIIQEKGYSQQQATIEAVCFMTALHGLCLNLYLFKTVAQDVNFEDCLGTIVSKFA